MEKEHRDILRMNRVHLVKNLSCLEEILDYLEASSILSENQRHTILSGITPADKIRKFLDVIVRCGPLAYTKFKESLKETNQSDLLITISSSDVPVVNSSNIISKSASPLVNEEVMAPDKGRVFPLKPYDVSSLPHGFVLIINIENYSETAGISNRLGSSQDEIKLQRLFEDFHYSVAVVRDLKGIELTRVVAEFVSKPEHSIVHAAGLVVLAHGLEHHIIASDGSLVSIDELVSFFTNRNCPRLAGKPKLIIIQACRGEQKGHVSLSQIDQSDSHLSNEISLDPSSWLSLPHMSDCVIVYSTLPGFVSWRSETDGSWYIRVLVDVFRLHGHRLHMLELLTEVNNRLVSEASSSNIKQISQPVTTLTKPFYLSTVDAA